MELTTDFKSNFRNKVLGGQIPKSDFLFNLIKNLVGNCGGYICNIGVVKIFLNRKEN